MNEIKEAESLREDRNQERRRCVGIGAPVSAIRKIVPVLGDQKYVSTIGIHRKEELVWPDEVDVRKFEEY